MGDWMTPTEWARRWVSATDNASAGVPDGYREVPATVYIGTDGTIVVTAEPSDVWGDDYDEDHPHNCDAMGCGWEHVVAVMPAPTDDSPGGAKEEK